ncbi:MAG: hypothetical protein GX879_11765 [Bacteroidales bacterium]|nr:hypothetical protein [Bacteroidales bacterium]
MKHFRWITIVLLSAVVVSCANVPPARRVVDPGPASVHLVVGPGTADAVAKVLTAKTGTEWGVASWTESGKPVVVTVGASTRQARSAHDRMCRSGGGWTGALLFELTSTGAKKHRTCEGITPPPAPPAPPAPSTVRQTGAASHYDDRGTLAWSEYPGTGFRSPIGCAHRTLPKGTRVTVSYHGRTTVCVVDDRGPYVSGRVIDLQPAQFDDLAPLSAGVLYGVDLSW